jgi:hypothetical protein
MDEGSHSTVNDIVEVAHERRDLAICGHRGEHALVVGVNPGMVLDLAENGDEKIVNGARDKHCRSLRTKRNCFEYFWVVERERRERAN